MRQRITPSVEWEVGRWGFDYGSPSFLPKSKSPTATATPTNRLPSHTVNSANHGGERVRAQTLCWFNFYQHCLQCIIICMKNPSHASHALLAVNAPLLLKSIDLFWDSTQIRSARGYMKLRIRSTIQFGRFCFPTGYFTRWSAKCRSLPP